MTLQLIDPNLIDPNPFQPSTRLDFTPESLADLESIRDIGFINTPRGRPSPPAQRGESEGGQRYQLVEGHRRRAAWMLYRPGLPMPIEIDAYEDRALFETMAIENIARLDLSAIERATLLKNYIDRFQATQAQAAKLLNLQSQSAVSNLLRLLKLPEPIQQQVQSGDLPERLARQLIPLATVRPEVATKIAQKVSKADESDREETARQGIWDVLRGKDVAHLHSAPWHDLAWPEKPIPVKTPEGLNPVITELPACKGCPYNMEHDGQNVCLRAVCFNLKVQAWSQQTAARIAKKLHIAECANGEKPTVIFDGESQREAMARKAVASKHSSLRIVASPGDTPYGSGWNRRDVLGSEYVALATIDEPALRKALAAIKEPKPAVNDWKAKQTQAARAKQNAQAKENRRLIDAALPHLLAAFPSAPVWLNLAWSDEFVPRGDWQKMSQADKPRALLRGMLLDKIGGRHWSPAAPADVRKKLLDLSADMKIKLPANWDAPVIPAKAGIQKSKPKLAQKRRPK